MEMEIFTAVTQIIANLGFPIFVAVYFITRMERHMKATNELLTVLVERTSPRCDHIHE